ncbi:hypothetical protein ES815_03225 [Leclercia adecarboxylata]|uniref:Uncharacterized protein n=1 Tax=Leclercia adecarboxylata TaxID=83655 RepID=A0AAP9D9U7_9ENTR|nr:hypothetical protein [Leclercia adecarboxylata]QDK17374.1 hypothetical protein ES815_03225 [Leclercia adecarboxylata]
MNNRPSSMSADSKKITHPGRQSSGVTVSLVGEFVGKTSHTTDGVSRRFLVDNYCVAGGCAGEIITLYVKSFHAESVGVIPDRITVELSSVYVVDKGTHSYASANHNFTTDYQPAKPKKKSQKNTRCTSLREGKVTARVPKIKPVRGKYK